MNNFYDITTIYTLLFKYCSKKEKNCEVSLFYVNDQLHIKFLDTKRKRCIFSDVTHCNNQEALLIISILINNFVLNNLIISSSFKNITLSNYLHSHQGFRNHDIKYNGNTYFNEKMQPMLIYELVGSNIVLKVYLYNGINPIIDEIHRIALNKVRNNQKYYKIKKIKSRR